MARWRLITGHYLNTVNPTHWEHMETDRGTGKANRQTFTVPLFMDPNDPADHNYPGEIIVALADHKHERKDILILGEPTPDMEPIDEEAEEISATLKAKWEHPIESLSTTVAPDYDELTLKMMEAFAKVTGQVAAPGVNASIPNSEVAELRALIADLQAQVATMKPSSPAQRRA